MIGYAATAERIKQYQRLFEQYRTKLVELKQYLESADNEFVSKEIRSTIDLYLLNLEQILLDMQAVIEQLSYLGRLLFPADSSASQSKQLKKQLAIRSVIESARNSSAVSQTNIEQQVKLDQLRIELRKNAEVLKAYAELSKTYQNLQKQFIDVYDRIFRYLTNKETILLKHKLKLEEKQRDEQTEQQLIDQITSAVLQRLQSSANLEQTITKLRQLRLQSIEINPDYAVDTEYRKQFIGDMSSFIDEQDDSADEK